MRFLTTAAALASLAIACSGEQAAPLAPEKPSPASIAVDAGGPDAPSAIDAGPPIAEAQARAILAARFRAAGLRVRYDVRVTGNGFELTADGFDPARGIGFEYVDPAELDTDLSVREASWIERDGRVLIVPPGTEAEVMRRADRFLAGKLGADAGP